MAITATLAIDNGVVTSGRKVTVIATISNSGGADVTVSAIAPRVGSATVSPAYSSQIPPSGDTVPAGGSVDVRWKMVFYLNEGSELVDNRLPIDVTCDILTSDGSRTTPSNTPQVIVTAALPVDGDLNMPSDGALHFSSNIQSGLLQLFF